MWTLWAAAVLFLVFGVKMAQEAREMQASHLQDEMREVEEELEEDTAEHDPNSVQLENLEEGRARPLENSLSAPSRDGSPAPGRNMRSSSRTRSRSLSPSRRMRPSITLGAGVGPLKIKEETVLAWRDTARNALEMMTNPVFAQAFALTFLGEWGDRSQITTIAMAGAHVSPPSPFPFPPLELAAIRCLELTYSPSPSSPSAPSWATRSAPCLRFWAEGCSRRN